MARIAASVRSQEGVHRLRKRERTRCGPSTQNAPVEAPLAIAERAS